MRYAYHTYFHFYPLTLEKGFDLKQLWIKQENKENPYPFPWTDIGYDDYECPDDQTFRPMMWPQ